MRTQACLHPKTLPCLISFVSIKQNVWGQDLFSVCQSRSLKHRLSFLLFLFSFLPCFLLFSFFLSVLFYSFLFSSNLFYLSLFYRVLLESVLFCLVLFCSVLSCCFCSFVLCVLIYLVLVCSVFFILFHFLYFYSESLFFFLLLKASAAIF